MGRKRLLPGVLPSHRRLDLIARREGGAISGRSYQGIIPALSDTIVSHVIVSGGSFKELISTTVWATNGAVPFNASEAIGFAGGASAESIGPFTAANYYSIASGFMAGTFDFRDNHNWIATIIVKRATVLSSKVPWSASDGSTLGPILLTAGGTQFQMDYGGGLANTGQSILANTPAVFSVGFNTVSQQFRIRLQAGSASGSGTGFGATHANCTPIALGRDVTVFQPWDGKIFEFCVRIPAAIASDADLDAQLLAINNAVMAAS